MKFLGTKVLSLLLCWLIYYPTMTAQVSIFAPTIQADPSTTIQANLTVSDFEDIGGISFSIAWDPSILEIQNIDDLLNYIKKRGEKSYFSRPA